MGSLMMRNLAQIGLLVATLALGPAAFSVQNIDGTSQRERAEQILNEPRFGETRPTLWDRFSDWWDDTFRSNSSQEPGANSGAGNDGSSTGGTGENGGLGSPSEGGGAPSSESGSLDGDPGSEGTAGQPVTPTATQAPQSGLAALGTALQMLLAGGVLVLIGLAARWLIARRTVRAKPSEIVAAKVSHARDPAELFAEADAAAAKGDFATAIRMRFKAGVARLSSRGLISAGDVTTNAAISDELGIEEFDELTETFERIVYGGHPASADLESESRTKWPAVMGRAR